MVVYQLGSDQTAGLLHDLIAQDALSASELRTELMDIGALPIALFRSGEQALPLTGCLHPDHRILLIDPHPDHAHGYAARDAHIFFMEADAHPLLGHHEDLFAAVADLHLDQLIVFL